MRLFVLCLAVVATHALAWQQGQSIDVTVKAGETITGTLISETEAGLLVRTAAGTRLLRFDDIAQVRATPAVSPQPVAAPPAPARKEIVDPRIEARKREREKADEEDRDPTLRRVRFSLFAEPGFGVAVVNTAATDSVRCTQPCVIKEYVVPDLKVSLGVSLAIPLSDLFWIRTSLSGFVNLGTYIRAGAELTGELFISPTSRLSFGLGGYLGLSSMAYGVDVVPGAGGAAFGVGAVVTLLSWRLSSHHRLSIPVHLGAYTVSYPTALTFKVRNSFSSGFGNSLYQQTVFETDARFSAGVQYELQF